MWSRRRRHSPLRSDEGLPRSATATVDGRAHIRPFGGRLAPGEVVRIGNRDLRVRGDGRVSIPADMMRRYGRLNPEGRYEIVYRLSSRAGYDPEKHEFRYAAQLLRPGPHHPDLPTGAIVRLPPPYIGPDGRLDVVDGEDLKFSG